MSLVLCSLFLLASQPADTQKLSEALGHWIGKNINGLDLSLDLEAIAKGMQEEAEGKESPLDEESCLKQISILEEEQRKLRLEKNRALAEEFLRENKDKKGISSLLEGKVQYQVLKTGLGEALSSDDSPLVRLDGKEELITLSEAPIGFKLGLQGMKEGEVRRLFIHPECGLSQELLTIEVELVRIAGAQDAQRAYQKEHLPEIPPLR